MKNKKLVGTIFIVLMLVSITVISTSSAKNMTKNKDSRLESLIITHPEEQEVFIIGNLTYKISTNMEVYGVGTNIYITLSVKNTGDEDRIISAPTSKTSDFVVLNQMGRKIFRASDAKCYMQVIIDTVIPAGETVYFNHTWNQKRTYYPWLPVFFCHQVRTGQYYIKAYISNAQYYPLSDDCDGMGTVELCKKISIYKIGILE